MKRRNLIKGLATTIPAWWLSKSSAAAILNSTKLNGEQIADGPFEPTWNSLKQYKVPAWFQDAKFGIWAHWGAQCQPEHGDWYARGMYEEGSDHYKYHVEKYGHPSKFGFKDVINEWKAENWNPDALVELYKNAGAKYFVAMANHHDNFDNFKSSYQSWNATKYGPKKDLIEGWAKAAKKHGLPFGVSVHASHAWMWYEPSQRSDKTGTFAGIPYDGKLTKTDGKNKWWDGLDPQELYAQNHPLSPDGIDFGTMWNWGGGTNVPSKAYCEKFFNRTVDLINKYQPDIVYFDDTALPLWPISDAGLRIAAYLYNESIKRNGKLQAVLNGKVLDEEQRKCMVWDIERGASNSIEPFEWQTDTCIGGWHYDRRIYNNKSYKTAATVIQTLMDVISKNGNLLLNIPVRGDGSIDELEMAIVKEIGEWMKINNEAVYATRPWKIFGEGPAIQTAAPLNAQGFNEGKGKPLGAEDFRFTTKGNKLYATFFEWPESGKVFIKSLASEKISNVQLLGNNDNIQWQQTADGLAVNLPQKQPCDNAYVLKII
ncbi:alpha-L-fucosidase [Panacibacter ginsenosidivorans]|uniref:alpha-L-fucosidase n=1 Tax=Panacibacter ginsenosidivorans TaxID=1813871 RepID=A0A5B8VCK8_9BACT|nr:alpha-L-fucosidase [Panacibacter ginsenosidivorans]QEC69210.1 alpha-L-fucosidase [Panacibacter ginsenosidivorans]